MKTCHRRGAFAMGGMAAFIPSRRDPEVNAIALAKVREDKEREASQGFDGTWVAHPDLVPVAREVFDAVLGDRPNQIERQRDDVHVDGRRPARRRGDPRRDHRGRAAQQRLGRDPVPRTPGSTGTGAVAIDNLMEDAATAEICRSQIWQWLHHGKVTLDDVAAGDRGGDPTTSGRASTRRARSSTRSRRATTYVEFLTVPAYDRLLLRETV